MGIAELQSAVLRHKSVFIDTMVFSYLLMEHPNYADLAGAVLNLIEQGEISGVTSMITVAEILTPPALKGDEQAARLYELYIRNFPNLTILPLDFDVARTTAKVLGQTRLRTPDAIQIAIALVAGVDAIITNDKQWQGKSESIDVIVLDDYLPR